MPWKIPDNCSHIDHYPGKDDFIHSKAITIFFIWWIQLRSEIIEIFISAGNVEIQVAGIVEADPHRQWSCTYTGEHDGQLRLAKTFL